VGSRDHAITCEVCGLQRGGLNDYKCLCDSAQDPQPPPSLEVKTQDDRDLEFEIKMMEHEGSMAPSMDARWQRGLAWLRELQHLRAVQRAGAKQDAVAPQRVADSDDGGEDCTTPQRAPLAQPKQGLPMPGAFSVQHLAWLHEVQSRRDALRVTEADALATLVRFRRNVTCVWCGNRYRSSVPGDLDRGLQGSHCASDVIQKDGEWFVRGGYGSDEHDMHRYVFVANPPSAPADPVCDECISERLQAGDLRDTGLECERRPADFGPRPFGTWGLVYQIRELAENEVALRRLAEVACKEHEARHLPSEPVAPCEVCAAIREYRKHQRWRGEIEDGGEEYAEGCPEVAGQLREAAKRVEELASFWERKRKPLGEAVEQEAPTGADVTYPESPSKQP